MVASRSSGRIRSKDVEEALVRKPAVNQQETTKIIGLFTHVLHDFRVCEIVDDDFAHLREMPSIPFLDPRQDPL